MGVQILTDPLLHSLTKSLDINTQTHLAPQQVRIHGNKLDDVT